MSSCPVEGDIAKAVIKHFPTFQRDYAALATKLENLDLAGVDRAETIQDSITEILRGDASDATTWLGGEQSPLYDDLLWARSVQKAFKNGIDTVIADLQTHCDEIAALPDFGVTGKLLADTAQARSEAEDFIRRDDFYAVMPDLQNRLKDTPNRRRKHRRDAKDRASDAASNRVDCHSKFAGVEPHRPR